MTVGPEKSSFTHETVSSDNGLLRNLSLFFHRKLTEKRFRLEPILPDQSAASQCVINWLVKDINGRAVAVTLRAARVNGQFGPSLLTDLDLFQQTVAARFQQIVAARCLFVGVSLIPAEYLEELTARHVAAYHYPTTGALKILRDIEDLLAGPLKIKNETD